MIDISVNYYLTNQSGLVIIIIIVLWNRGLKNKAKLETYICEIIIHIINVQFVLGQKEQQKQPGQLEQLEESQMGTAGKQSTIN